MGVIHYSFLVCFCSHLHEVLKKCKMTDMIAFIYPACTNGVGYANSSKLASGLAKRYEQGKPDQIFLMPYNSGYVQYGFLY